MHFWFEERQWHICIFKKTVLFKKWGYLLYVFLFCVDRENFTQVS